MTLRDTLPEALVEAARQRLAEVRGRIADAAKRAGRRPEEIRLVGVAKRQPRERILATIDAGLDTIGQSYLQEAREVRPAIEASLARAFLTARVPHLEWRLVGRLQRNKAALAARLFDAIESVDRPELADVLSKRAGLEGRELEILIQVSLCGEPQKGGCEPDRLEALAERILQLPHLRLAGLMTVPAAHPDPERARPIFASLRERLATLATLDPTLVEGALSMGMSADLDVAVEEGATLVRVGTALFGERIDPKRKTD